MAAGIKIEGLNKFLKKAQRAEALQPGEFRLILNVVGKGIARDTRKKMEDEFVSEPAVLTGALVRSVRTKSTAKVGIVAIGSKVRAPYAGWWEFGGGHTGGNRDNTRKFVKQGRTLWPSYMDNRDDIAERMHKSLNKISKAMD